MNIIEVKHLKNKMEEKIISAIAEFETLTNLSIYNEINYRNSWYCDSHSDTKYTPHRSLKTIVEIEENKRY